MLQLLQSPSAKAALTFLNEPPLLAFLCYLLPSLMVSFWRSTGKLRQELNFALCDKSYLKFERHAGFGTTNLFIWILFVRCLVLRRKFCYVVQLALNSAAILQPSVPKYWHGNIHHHTHA